MTVTPDRIFNMLFAHVQSSALKGAIDIGLFTAIGEGAGTATAIAARCRCSERGVRILCDYLTVFGLLEKQDGGVYRLAPDAALFLDARSQAYVGTAAEFLGHPFHREAAADVARTVRTGTTILNGSEYLEIENEVWVAFAKGMMPLMIPAAQFMSSKVRFDGVPERVLDIAAGHGIFGIQTAMSHAQVKIDALDWPGVLAVAEENARRFGVHERWNPLPGNAMELPFDSGYGAIYLTNFLHHYNPADCIRLLKKCRAALAPGGSVLILEFVPNSDRVSPPGPATFAMTMLLNTPAGDAYTFPEFQSMLSEAGFTESTCEQVPMSNQQLVTAK